MSRARIVVTVLIAAGMVHAQSPGGSVTGPAFEVASVKLFLGGGRGGRPSRDAGQFSWPGATLRQLLVLAYTGGGDEVVGPDWLGSAMYSVSARIPAGAAPDEFGPMLQNLLTERFRMTIHREIKVVDGYDLVVGKGGPKLKESVEAQEGGGGQFGPDGANLTFNKVTMQAFATRLGMRAADFRGRESMGTGSLGRVRIADKTGLTGVYDIKLHYALAGDALGEDIFSAVQSQLGLTLKPTKVSINVVVVDRAEKTPTEN